MYGYIPDQTGPDPFPQVAQYKTLEERKEIPISLQNACIEIEKKHIHIQVGRLVLSV